MIDITSFNLEALQQLHLTYQSVLESHLTQLENIEPDDSNASAISLLKLKISNFEQGVQIIANRIIQLNGEKLRFSNEYIFWNFGMFKKSFQVTFVTTSEAHQRYGSYVTGSAIYDRDEMEKLVELYKAGEWNDGYIKFEYSVGDLTQEQKDLLRTEGFKASDIDSIAFI